MKNSNKKTIARLAICIAFAMIVPACILLCISKPMPGYQVFGICAGAGLVLGIVEMLLIGLSDRHVHRYHLSQAIDIGYLLTFLAGTIVSVAYVTPLSYSVLVIIAIAILQIIYHFIFLTAGTQIYYHRQKKILK